MITRTVLFAIAISAAAAPAFAGPSGQHSDQALLHSGQAVGHGSAAVASGTATVVAVPIVAAGSVIAVTGAALESIGTGAMDAGLELSTVGATPDVQRIPAPNAAPSLD